MARIPVLTRDDMSAEGKQVHDEVMASTGRVGRGPSVGYAHAPALWKLNNDSTAYQFGASLTAAQVRLELMREDMVLRDLREQLILEQRHNREKRRAYAVQAVEATQRITAHVALESEKGAPTITIVNH